MVNRERTAPKEIIPQRSRVIAELPLRESQTELLRELVAHLRQNRTLLREEWAARITEAQLLAAMTKEEIFPEATSVYDNYVEALATGTFGALQSPTPATFRTHHSSRRRNPRSRGHRAAAARRTGAIAVRQVSERFRRC